MTSADLQIRIQAKDEASRALKGVGGSLATLGKVAGVTALAGSAMAVAFGVSAVKSFNESEKSIAQLDAVLKSTNGAAKVTRESALNLASALQKQTTFSDEAVLSAENMLLTFTNIKDNVFPDATKIVLDMSTALGQDTKSSAIQLGKALNDPINGITALRRVGVNFTEDQKTQIETLVKSGKTMEAQKLILQELGTEFGGSAAAQAQTFEGKMLQLNNVFDDFKEVVGGAIVTYLTPFLAKLTEFANTLPVLLENAQATWRGFRDGIAGVMVDTNIYWVFLKDFFIPIVTSLRDTFIDSWNKIREAIKPIEPELKMLAVFFGVIIVGAIIVLIKTLAEIIKVVAIVVTKTIQLFSGMIQFLRGLFEGFFSFILGDNENAVASFKKAWEVLKSFFKVLFEGILSVIMSPIQKIIDLINKVIAGYNNIAGKMGRSTINEIRLDKRATGGSVSSNQPYMVGENGPELFVPSGNGSIKNSPASLGGGITIQINHPTIREDYDITRMASEVEKVLGRKQELIRMGAL